jgi:hypothetical protein
MSYNTLDRQKPAAVGIPIGNLIQHCNLLWHNKILPIYQPVQDFATMQLWQMANGPFMDDFFFRMSH